MTINNNPRPYILTIFVLMCICILLLTNKCKRQVVSSNNVTPELIKRDSFRTIVKYRDSVRIQHVHHWNKIKLIDTLPCDTFVKLVISKCDTVIKYDSLQIVSLNDLVKQDSVIIGKLLEGKKEDSLSIVKLNKKLKRQKVLTKLGFITGILAGGAVGIKIN